jgi:hypothetical protein
MRNSFALPRQTSGLDATTVTASALSSTGAMLMSIWSAGGRQIAVESEAAIAQELPIEKLPAQSLVVIPIMQPERLAVMAADVQ